MSVCLLCTYLRAFDSKQIFGNSRIDDCTLRTWLTVIFKKGLLSPCVICCSNLCKSCELPRDLSIKNANPSTYLGNHRNIQADTEATARRFVQSQYSPKIEQQSFVQAKKVTQKRRTRHRKIGHEPALRCRETSTTASRHHATSVFPSTLYFSITDIPHLRLAVCTCARSANWHRADVMDFRLVATTNCRLCIFRWLGLLPIPSSDFLLPRTARALSTYHPSCDQLATYAWTFLPFSTCCFSDSPLQRRAKMADLAGTSPPMRVAYKSGFPHSRVQILISALVRALRSHRPCLFSGQDEERWFP